MVFGCEPGAFRYAETFVFTSLIAHRASVARALARGVLVLTASAVAATTTLPLRAQQPDSLRKRATDSTSGVPRRLKAVTIVTERAERAEPLSTTYVPRATLRRATATSTTPWELLRQTAGIEVHEQGQGPGFASDASVRGYSSDHSTDLALWIDGVPINETVNGHAEGNADWSLIFQQTVSDLDVIKGPSSALFGNFALAGVVNVRTLERLRGTEIAASSGAFGRADASVLTGFDNGTSGGGVLGARLQREDGWRPHAGYDIGQVHARLVRGVSHTSTLDAGIELYGARWDSPGFLTAEQFARRDFDVVRDPTDGGYKRRAQERVSLRVVRNDALWRTTLYATQSQWELYLNTPPEGGAEEGTGGQTEEEDARYGFGLTSALTWTRNGAELTFGAEGRYDHAHYQNWLTTRRVRNEPQELDRSGQLSAALFMQSTAALGERIRMSAGARVDAARTRSDPDEGAVVSASHAVLSPKAGASFRLSSTAMAYTNVARGFRSSDNVNADPTLPFITAWAYEGGLKLDRARVTASAAVFRTDVSNEQTFDPVRLTSTSGGASRRQGLELDVTGVIARRLTLTGNWTFTDAKYRRLVTDEGDVLNGARVFNTAEYVGASSIEYAPPGAPWSLRLGGNWVGPYAPFAEPDVLLGGYGLLHASATAHVGHAVLQFGLRNALNRTYAELRAGGFVGPGQPRTFTAGLRYTF